jgi:hypothetical protein
MSDSKTTILTTLITTLIGGVIGGAVTLGGSHLAYSNKDKELDIQLVNVGLSILRGEATGDKETEPARRFALRLLREYTEVEIPEEEYEKWATKGTTPFKNTNLVSSIHEPVGRQYEVVEPEINAIVRIKIADEIEDMVKQNCIRIEYKSDILSDLIELSTTNNYKNSNLIQLISII